MRRRADLTSETSTSQPPFNTTHSAKDLGTSNTKMLIMGAPELPFLRQRNLRCDGKTHQAITHGPSQALAAIFRDLARTFTSQSGHGNLHHGPSSNNIATRRRSVLFLISTCLSCFMTCVNSASRHLDW